MSKFIQFLVTSSILAYLLSVTCDARALETESAHFYENFISSINSQTPQRQLSLLNYLMITDWVSPDLDKTKIIDCLDHLAESGTSLTVRNHARLIRLALSTAETSQIPEPAIHSNNENTKNAVMIFLKYINDNFFNGGTSH
jgi:hypothetical protein